MILGGEFRQKNGGFWDDRQQWRHPWLRMCEWAAVAGFDEASNMALDQIARLAFARRSC
jgi:hypothetical protein